MPRYQFKSRLPIEITGEIEERTTNILRGGGAKVALDDASFALFLPQPIHRALPPQNLPPLHPPRLHYP